MFERTLDTEHVFGQHGPMSRTRVRRRRRIAAALGAWPWRSSLSAPVAGALGRHGGRIGTEVQPARRWEHVVVVQPGDTVWSIAEAAAGGADPRALVDAIATRNGIDAGAVVPGQSLVIPSRRLTTPDGAGTVRAATTCCGVTTMRCPWCDADDDRVVDSRSADGGAAIRRRRECVACGRRYTTFERVEDVGLVVVKRDGSKDPFDRAKLESGILKAIKNRPVSPEQVERVVDQVEERLRRKGPEVTSQAVGVEVLAGLAKLDQVAYMRFASVYKDFQEITDFQRELDVLLEKKTPAKPRSR